MPKSGATNQTRSVEGQPMWSNVFDLTERVLQTNFS
jgi:hypothetical protein